MKSERIVAVEALRFLAMVQICILHFTWPSLAVGYLGVEFFFILAGVFIYRLSTTENSPGILSYTRAKVSKFYFKYFIGILLCYCTYHVLVYEELRIDPLATIMHFITQLLMWHHLGFSDGSYNSPMWFFSVLTYGGMLVYGLTKYKTKDCVRFIFPILVVVTLTMVREYGNFENWGIYGIISFPLLRGTADMAFGVLVGYLFFNYNEVVGRHKSLLNIASIISLTLYIAVAIVGMREIQTAIILITILLTAAMTPGTWLANLFRGRVWLMLGRLSFDMFIIHFPLQTLWKHFLYVERGMSLEMTSVFYYVSLIPLAWLFDITCRRMQKLLFR